MSEVCLLPRPSFLERSGVQGAITAQTLYEKTLFQKRLQYCANIPEARAKGFSQRTAVCLTIHFIYLICIIHISYVLYITYIFYTFCYTIFSRSTSTSTSTPSSSSSPIIIIIITITIIIYLTYTIFITHTIFFHQPHLHDIHHLQRTHELHHHLYHCILYIAYIFKPI